MPEDISTHGHQIERFVGTMAERGSSFFSSRPVRPGVFRLELFAELRFWRELELSLAAPGMVAAAFILVGTEGPGARCSWANERGPMLFPRPLPYPLQTRPRRPFACYVLTLPYPASMGKLVAHPSRQDREGNKIILAGPRPMRSSRADDIVSADLAMPPTSTAKST